METSWWLASLLVDLVRLKKGPIPNFSFLGSLEVFFENIPGDGQADADEGNSDNKAISVQLGWDLTQLGKNHHHVPNIQSSRVHFHNIRERF